VARAAEELRPEFLKELGHLHLKELADLGRPVFSAGWVAWSVVQAKYRHTPIDFDYVAYAKSRFDGWHSRQAQATVAPTLPRFAA